MPAENHAIDGDDTVMSIGVGGQVGTVSAWTAGCDWAGYTERRYDTVDQFALP